MCNTLLYIDDDPIALLICKKVNAKTTFCKEVITAKNGQDALELYQKLSEDKSEIAIKQIDLIFLDLNMPVMNGWKFLETFTNEEYARLNKTTKVIIISSTIDPQDLARAKNFPIVVDFLPKPITVEMLEYLMEKLK